MWDTLFEMEGAKVLKLGTRGSLGEVWSGEFSITRGVIGKTRIEYILI